ncbi:MAG: hypothetical protein RLZZ628_887 [Bacteroidota bacterium]
MIVCDDQDAILGDYFKACKEDIEGFFTEQKKNGFPLEIVEIIYSNNCHAAYIDQQLTAYQNQHLIMIAYSHGLPHALRCKGTNYIDSYNIYLLFNACFYTNACSVGATLGKQFEGKQGAFIGFSKEVVAFQKASGMMKASIDCDNCGLKYIFCNPTASIQETYRTMKAFYNQIIDKYTDIYDPITIGQLLNTRDALKIYGNRDFTLQNYLSKEW